jgi:hypothetical protein
MSDLSFQKQERVNAHFMEENEVGVEHVQEAQNTQRCHFSATCLTRTKLVPRKSLKWCRGTELNCRHQPFQGCALPTELPRHGSGQEERGTVTGSSEKNQAAWSVWLIWFVLFIWLIWFTWLVSFNQTHETDRIDQMNKMGCGG